MKQLHWLHDRGLFHIICEVFEAWLLPSECSFTLDLKDQISRSNIHPETCTSLCLGIVIVLI
jgi:hypothetical protein